MKRMPPAQAEHQLTYVANAFADWRQTHVPLSDSMPQHLWEHAIALTKMFSITRVATRLGINGEELHQRCGARHTAPAVVSPLAPDFLEVPVTPAWLPPPSGMEIELQRPDGARLRIHADASQCSLTALVRTFLENS
jgi:hypothetical protein